MLLKAIGQMLVLVGIKRFHWLL